MKRRDFIGSTIGAIAAWPFAARAQQPALPVIGYLNTVEPSAQVLRALLDGLADAGFVEGKTVRIERRYGDARYDRLPALAADLVRLKVDVIVTGGGTPSALAARAATDTLPIVALVGADPTQIGLAQSFGRPGGNVTGVAQLVGLADGKRLEFIHAIVPAARTVAYLTNPDFPATQQRIADIEDKARTLGVELAVLKATDEAGIETAFAAIDRAKIGALVVGGDSLFFATREKLATLSNQHKVPTMYFFREFAIAGGLASYGTNLNEAYHTLGAYAAKILKGAKPADLPFAQQSEKIELVINLKTAKALGLTIPPTILAHADEVLE